MSTAERLQGLERELLAVEQLVLNLRISVGELRTALVAEAGAATSASSAAGVASGPTAESESQTVVRPTELLGPATPPKGGKVYVVYKAGAGYPIGLYLSYRAYAEAVRDHSVPWNGRAQIAFQEGTESEAVASLGAGRDAWHRRFGTDYKPPRWN